MEMSDMKCGFIMTIGLVLVALGCMGLNQKANLGLVIALCGIGLSLLLFGAITLPPDNPTIKKSD
jgi:hypothetical protein